MEKMIKVFTVCSQDHLQYLHDCEWSVSLQCAIGYHHEVKIDKGNGGNYYRNQFLESINNNNIIGILDADDTARGVWLSESLKHIASGYDVVYCDYNLAYKNGNAKRYYGKEFDRELLKKVNFIPHSGVVIKGHIAKQARYSDLKFATDWHYLNQLAEITDKFKHINEPLIWRRDWTSFKKKGLGKVPIIRKIRRKYYNNIARKEIQCLF